MPFPNLGEDGVAIGSQDLLRGYGYSTATNVDPILKGGVDRPRHAILEIRSGCMR